MLQTPPCTVHKLPRAHVTCFNLPRDVTSWDEKLYILRPTQRTQKQLPVTTLIAAILFVHI